MSSAYVCPRTKVLLFENDIGLVGDGGVFYPYLKSTNNTKIPNFLAAYEEGYGAEQSLAMYAQETSFRTYRNFLDWLFQTFNENEASFRARLIGRLRANPGSRVLVTGCGMGDDIPPLLDALDSNGEVYASDLAAEMVLGASSSMLGRCDDTVKIHFSVCNAAALPFPDNFFDGAFHFGGLNLFDNIKLSISEMERVVKPTGRVVFGDEGIAPWLRGTEYAQIAINNNRLWASAAPIDLLPRNAVDVCLTWVLGNCFYLIDFEVSESGPIMNIDVPHKGRRGGSMRTRYFGNLEGVTKESKEFVVNEATKQGISVHEWLEQIIREKRRNK